MKYSLQTRIAMLCLLLVFVMAVGHILTLFILTNMADLSPEFSEAATQSIWRTALLLLGGAVLICLVCIFRLIIPYCTRSVTNLAERLHETERRERLKAGEIDEIGESGTFAEHVHSLQEQVQETQDSLIKERNLLRTLIDTLPDLIYIKDTSHRFVVANEALVKHIGVEKIEELLGKSDLDLMPFAFASRYYEDERTVLESGTALIDRIEPGIERKTGAKRWYLSTKVPYYNHQGNVEGIIGIGRDITRLEQEMEALQELVAGLSWENLFLSESRKTEDSEEEVS